jgi:hypothetical protein
VLLFFFRTHVRILPTISDDTEDISIDPHNPADVPDDVMDADTYEELLRENLSTTNPDQMTPPEIPEIPDLTQREDQNEEGNQADVMPMLTVVDKFPFGSPGMPIPDKPRTSTVYESRQATSMDSLWAPFRSELDWNIAQWVKMRGSTSTAVTELLAIPGVRYSHQSITMGLTQM